MKLLTRYVLREHVPPFLFALAALTGLMLLNQVARYFGSLVGKGLPWSVIGEFFALSVPFILAMTLPMAVLVAALYAFVRLAADNEVTALRASGVNLVTLVRPVLIAASVLAVATFVFVDQLLPPANHQLKSLMIDIARKKPTFELKEQMINEVIPQQFYLRAGRIDQAADRLRDVVIYDLTNGERRRTIYADSGYMRFNADRTDLWLTLYDGYVHDYDRTQPDLFRQIWFHTDLVKKAGISDTLQRSGPDVGRGDREMSECEMRSALNGQLVGLAKLRRDRERLLVNDVRGLLGAPLLPASDTLPLRPRRHLVVASLYCRALAGLGAIVKPPAAGAQEPVRGRRRPPPPTAAAKRALLRSTRRVPVPDTGRPAVRFALPRPPAALAASPHAAGPPDLSGATLKRQMAVFEAQRTALQQEAASYEIEMHKKFAIAAACLVFVLIGAPTALRFPRGGVGLVIGASVLIFGFYYVGLIGGETLADDLIVSPFWAMWGANLFMSAIGVALFLRLNRQRIAARGRWRDRMAALRHPWRHRGGA